MEDAGCSPAKGDGELVEPCISCRLILDGVVDNDGNVMEVRTITAPSGGRGIDIG